MADLKKKLDD